MSGHDRSAGCPTFAAFLFLRLRWDIANFNIAGLYQSTTSVVPKTCAHPPKNQVRGEAAFKTSNPKTGLTIQPVSPPASPGIASQKPTSGDISESRLTSGLPGTWGGGQGKSKRESETGSSGLS